MSKTHTVKSGDTLGKISVQYYGRFTKWNDIVKANPQLTGRKTASDGSPVIFPGDVLLIPEEKTAPKNNAPVHAKQTIVLDENAKKDLALYVDGVKILFSRNSDGEVQAILKMLEDGKVELATPEDVKIENDKNITLKSGADMSLDASSGKMEVKSTETTFTGGTVKCGGSVTPDGNGPFCGIKICPFTGAPQCGSQVSGT